MYIFGHKKLKELFRVKQKKKAQKNDNERITNKITNVINNGNGSGDIQQADTILLHTEGTNTNIHVYLSNNTYKRVRW